MFAPNSYSYAMYPPASPTPAPYGGGYDGGYVSRYEYPPHELPPYDVPPRAQYDMPPRAQYDNPRAQYDMPPRARYDAYDHPPREQSPLPVAAPYKQFDQFYARPKLPKLYVSKISANCLGPWLLLKEVGVPFELVEVDLTKGDNHTNEFLAMNPMGQVPTYVETDGTVIWESNAIMRFISEKHTVPKHTYPKDVNLRGRIEMALDWRQTVLYPNIAKVCYPALGFTKDRSRVSEGRESLDKDLRILSDFFLRETPFIGGALPCIADYAIGFPLLLLYATDYRITPKVREYLENLASKSPSWNEVTEELKRFISRL